MRTICSNPQVLEVNWVRPLYTVSVSTIRLDRRRQCWICHHLFKIGENLSVVSTPEGVKIVHSDCMLKEIKEGINSNEIVSPAQSITKTDSREI